MLKIKEPIISGISNLDGRMDRAQRHMLMAIFTWELGRRGILRVSYNAQDTNFDQVMGNSSMLMGTFSRENPTEAIEPMAYATTLVARSMKDFGPVAISGMAKLTGPEMESEENPSGRRASA